MAEVFTGERLETFVYNENTIKHLHRYALAIDYIEDKIVLDIASGEGYGSNLLSKNASFVYGVDIDHETIQKAKFKYKNNNLKFLQGSTSKIPLGDDSVDVVISFETIEHHDEHDKMLEEIKRVLRQKGVLIISTPDKHFYSDIRNYKNEYHVKELYKSQFEDLLKNYFNFYQFLTQRYLNGNSLIFDDSSKDKLKFYTGNYLELKEIFSHPHFIIALASNESFIQQSNSIFDGNEILQNCANIDKHVKRVYNSTTYKLGHTLLSPFIFLRKRLRRFKNRK